MIVTLLLWLYILAFCWLYGCLTFRAMSAVAGVDIDDAPAFAVVVLVGLTTVSVLTGYLAFPMNIDWLAHAILLALSLVAGALQRHRLRAVAKCHLARLRETRPPVLLMMLGASLVALELTAASPTMYDTGYYHAKAIRWLEEYGVVPGLGNLHSQLAFSQTWFWPSALFSMSFLGLRSFHVLNGAIFFALLTFAWGGLQTWFSGSRRPSHIIRIGLGVAGLLLFSNFLSSPSSDVPAAVLLGPPCP